MRQTRNILLSVSSRGAIAAAAAVLRRGGIVAFPTETVYGVAVRYGDSKARARLARMKLRAAGKPFQLLVSSRASALKWDADWSKVARTFARRFWPGPLTLVVRGRNGRWVGLRVPDHPAARRLAKLAGGAMIATSANLAGQAPARNAEGAAKALGLGVDLVLDGGPARLGKASSVVRVRGETWELLREGAISRKMLSQVPEGLVRKGAEQ